jgi:hypothetical protein
MRVIDLMEILEKFRNKSDLGYCQVRIVMPNDNYRKQYKIKEITFAPNKLVGQAEKHRMIVYVEE